MSEAAAEEGTGERTRRRTSLSDKQLAILEMIQRSVASRGELEEGEDERLLHLVRMGFATLMFDLHQLTADARGLREEAEGFARDMRLSVEAYAKQHRRQAEEEARSVIAEAEKESTSMREGAEQMVRQVEGDVRRRQEELRGEVRMLEHRKREALERLREIAAAVQDMLPAEDSIARDLQPQTRS